MINNKKINHKLILGFLCFLFLFSIQAKAIVVPEIAGNVDLTTNFKDNTWGKSAIFTEFTDSNGIKAIVKTKLYLMHDKDNLYVGFECLDQNPKKLISNDRYLPDGDAVFLLDFGSKFHKNSEKFLFSKRYGIFCFLIVVPRRVVI